MKKVFIGGISLYQSVLYPFATQFFGIRSACRFSPTCSEYAKVSLQKYGIVKGSLLSLKRILSCQPFNKHYGKSF